MFGSEKYQGKKKKMLKENNFIMFGCFIKNNKEKIKNLYIFKLFKFYIGKWK